MHMPKQSTRRSQPIEVAKIPDAMLRKKTVADLMGVSESTLDRRVRDGSVPKPVRFNSHTLRWPARVITAWLRRAAKEHA